MATENTRAFAENVAWAFSAHNMATSRALNINTIRKSTYNTAQTYEQSPSIKYGEELAVLARSSLSRGSEVPRVPERSAHRSKNERVFINGWRATQNRSRCVGLPEHREIERNSRGPGIELSDAHSSSAGTSSQRHTYLLHHGATSAEGPHIVEGP